MPSNHLILCHPFLLLPSIFPSIRVFCNESVLCIRWPKYWSFSISLSSECSRLISFRIDWFDLLADSEESSPTPQFKSINSLALINSSLWSNSHVHTWLLECRGYVTTMVFIVFEIFQTFNYYLLQWTVISDLLCQSCKKITTCWRSWWWSAFFSSTLFLIGHVHCVFGCDCTLSRLQYSVNIISLCTWKPGSRDSLYCGICFVVSVFHRNHSISKVCHAGDCRKTDFIV